MILLLCPVQWRKNKHYSTFAKYERSMNFGKFVLKGISLWIQQLKRLSKFSTADLKILQLNKNHCSWFKVPVTNLKMITIFNFLLLWQIYRCYIMNDWFKILLVGSRIWMNEWMNEKFYSLKLYNFYEWEQWLSDTQVFWA